MTKLRWFLTILLAASLYLLWYVYYPHNYGKVSVIVPAYNVSAYIDKCMTSLTQQTYRNLEILVVDDDSTDDTYEKLQAWARKDKRIKLFRNEQNGGASAARERAFKEVTGDAVMYVDSDDFIQKDYISPMIKTLKESGAEVVLNNTVIMLDERQRNYKRLNWWFNFDHLGFLSVPPQCRSKQGTLWGKIFRTDFLRRINVPFPHIRHHADHFMHMAMMAQANKIYVMEGDAYVYRFRPGSLQTEKVGIERPLNFIHVSDLLWQYYVENGLTGTNKLDVFQLRRWIHGYESEKPTIYAALRQLFLKTNDEMHRHPDLYFDRELEFVEGVVKHETYADFMADEQSEYWLEQDPFTKSNEYCKNL